VSANVRLIIPFKGLKDGKHNFIFKINNKFFESLEYSEIKEGNLNLDVKVNKSSHHILLEYCVNGVVNISCDRCLEYFDIKLKNSGKFYVRFSDENEDNDEGFITVSTNAEVVDFTHYIYESLILGLPSQRMHPLDAKGKSSCNKEMIKKLGQFYNKGKIKNEIDSRWEKLKEINN
jgi:uncharacterized protein